MKKDEISTNPRAGTIVCTVYDRNVAINLFKMIPKMPDPFKAYKQNGQPV